MEKRVNTAWIRVSPETHERLTKLVRWRVTLGDVVAELLDHIDQCPLAAVSESLGKVPDEAENHSSRHHQRELARV
jgi:hypothetical protein